MSGARRDELRLAFQLLSRLPVGRLAGAAPPIAASGWAWPLVGAVLGAGAALACQAALWAGLTPLMSALIALAAGALLTGAMHEDGLADLADGFGGGRGRTRKLEIMRDSRIGSYGVAALILAFGFRTAGLGAVIEGGHMPAALIALGAGSRAVLPAALLLMPPARSDGLGHAARAGQRAPALIAAVAGALFLLLLGPGAALSVAVAVALSTGLLGVLALRQIGGQTGDVMGAMQQIAECAGWAALVAVL